MNRKRNTALISLAVVATLATAACGSDETKDSSSGSTTAASSALDCSGAKDKLSAEGSSAQKNAFDEFAAAYAAVCSGKSIAYNPTGSGAGREQFIAKNVDFAGSDSALSEEEAAKAKERCGGDAWNLPVVFGPVALAYNVSGVDKLVLNAEVTAKLFTGAIEKWNDPAIAALNPGVSLPDTKVTPVYRSDKSGTSENFGRYLETAAPQAWDKGHDGTWKGGAGEGAEKSAGVADKVKNIAGSITYVEKGYADDLGLKYAQIDNGAGAVELTAETAAHSVDQAKFAGTGNDLKLDLASIYGTKDAGSYPILLATYEIVCSQGYDAETSKAVKNFLTVAINEGQAGLAEIGYAPLPDAFKTRLTTAINAIG